MNLPDESQRNLGSFVDQYLEHLEKRDSREGVTKWLLLAALAAVLWQMSTVAFSANVETTSKLVFVALLLYYVCDFTSTILSAGRGADVLRLRLKTGASESSVISVISVRFIVTGIGFWVAFGDVEDVWRGMASAPPLVLGGVLLIFTLGEFKRKYIVLKPHKNSKNSNIIALAILILPVIVGLYFTFKTTRIAGLFIAESSLSSLQSAGLILAMFFLVERYARVMRVDGEIAAVRRIWRRKGFGEISAAEAADELRLIVLGAGLSDIISHDVNRFTQKIHAIAEMESAARKELEKLQELDGSDEDLIHTAVTNSLRKRSEDLQEMVIDLESRRDEIIGEVKRLIDDEKLESVEAKELGASLDERFETTQTSVKLLISQIDSGIESKR